MNDTVLDIRHLTLSLKKNGNNVPIFEDVSFRLCSASILAVVGESGGGKSMLCKSILRLLPQNADLGGEVILSTGKTKTDFLSCSESGMERVRGNRIGMIFQEPAASMNPVMRCGRQVLDALQPELRKERQRSKSRVLELFESVGLKEPQHVFYSYPHELSGGMIQKVAIAIALAGNPSVLIADEPSTALDAVNRFELIELFQRLRIDFGTSILWVTHELRSALTYANELLVLYAGKVMESGKAAEIAEHPKHPYTKALLDVEKSFREPDGPRTIPEEILPAKKSDGRCVFAGRCEFVKPICQTNEPKWESDENQRSWRCHFPLSEKQSDM